MGGIVATTYRLYYGTDPAHLAFVVGGITDLFASPPGVPMHYGTQYYWRVDAVNEYGTTTGDVWSFTTLGYDPPQSSMRYKTDGSLVPLGTPYDESTMYFTGENFASGGIGRLVAAANGAIWYEEVTV
jgi:hypothetical protein